MRTLFYLAGMAAMYIIATNPLQLTIPLMTGLTALALVCDLAIGERSKDS